ncbi:type I polyketide synthase [Mycobacterium spongiae]|uniref:SDR family oxidoreductase n=1 Tax=Mycobacterium spongiae TaxID=886343 RepID=A0A975PY68_9MYCO|nr:type I polyketide synthase [Mycobacterium spongiae]QUR68935.1 SDR family oxidoreductase [Mycobacterium spongiae]
MSTETRLREYLQKATNDLRKSKQRVRNLERRVREPVAVVGMGCRYPGGVGSAEGLWDVVVGGRDVIGDFPGDRGWDVGGLFDADPDVVGKFYNRHGGFLDDAAGFDAGFFGVSPREALAMDPQQRLLLETAWETFESAGIDPESLRGSDTGVFAGVMGSQYGFGGGAAVEGYVSTGGAGSVASGRIAYVFGLEGPAVTVDTACSSSLVALHQACQSLRVGECSLALAGGVTVMATPVTFVEFSRQRGLSVDGRCKAFAAGADGTGFSEGVGLVLLERLSDARRCGHEVLGVIGGSAVNQDGASNGLTAPNGPSQERVIRSALACAGVSGVDVDVVEAHGTGTTLGDPIEAQAILATYGQGRQWDRPLWLGSVKSNMGHTQAAAGVAGVIKMIEALRHEVLPVTLHVDAPSPHVDWSVGAVRLLTEAQPWPRVEGRVRRAGVSSFGISGTNAHVIVEEAPAVPADSDGGLDGVGVGVGEVVWVVSAKSEAALGAQAARLARYVGARPELGVADVGWSLATGRAGLGYRGAVVGDTREELLAGLAALAGGGCGGGVVTGRVVEGKTAFVFPGQGGQWPAMAVELLDSSPVFAERMRACGEALAPFVEWSLDEVLRGGVAESALTRVDVVQPVLFAVMVSMAELWRSCGVRADMVIGHSQGEIAAAHVAGGLSLDDAARVVAVRSRMIAELAGDGGMASIGLPVDQVDARLQCWQGRISVAAHNSPASTVVSGDRDALHELVSGCEGEGVFARLIPVDYASHSVEVETLRDRLIGELSSIRPGVGEIPFYSTVSGARVGTDTLDAEYWYRNLRQRVQFEHATAALLDQGVRTFIEMGPHPVLTVAISETVEARGGDPASVSVVGSLRRDEGDWRRFLTSLAEAFVAGVGVDWSSVFGSWGPRRVGLPSYAFEHQRFWLDSSRGGVGDLGSVGLAGVGHPWLGVGVCLGGERGWLFSGRVGLDTHPWLADHAVLGVVLLPGTGFVEMVLAAGARAGLDCVDELVLEAPLVLSEGVGVALQVLVGGVDDAGCCRVDVYSRPETASGGGGEQGSWVRHGTGVLSAGGAAAAAGAAAAGGGGLLGGQWPPVGAQVVDVDVLYEGLAEAGFEYGPAFQGVRGVWRRGEQTFVEVALSGDGGDEGAGFGVHPALFDAVLHPGAALMMQGLAEGQVGLPFAWRGVWLGSGGVSVLRVVLEGSGSGGLRIVGVDESGAAVLGVESLDVRPVDAAGLARVGGESVESLHAVGWVAVDAAQPVSSVVVVGGGPVDLVGVLGGQVAWYPDVAGLVEAVGGGGSVPQVVVMAAPVAGAGEVAGCVREGVYGTLELVQAWLAEPALVASRLVLVTRGGVGVGEGQTPDLVVAAVDGLVRSAVGEHPGRFGLVDLDDDGGDGGVGLRAALGVVDEPRVAVRGGVVLAPRLTRVSTQLPQSGVGSVFDPQDTVLITGGTGVLGMALARHLVVEYGCGHVVLVSRRGAAAVGVDQLRGELAEHGCRVEIVAADIADRDQLGAVVGAIRAQHRLGAVVHAAGVLADGVIESMDREQVEQVLGVKVDAAWALHELTADMGLSAFVLFSSAAGIFGSAGQANYAAANAFLDGLAQYRRGLGLSGVSLAWGLWEQASAMTGQLGQVDQARIERMGLRAMTTGQGLGLFDLACGRAESVLVPAVFDHAVLRAQARAGTLPVLLGGLVRTPVKRGRVATLAQRLAQTPETEWDDVVLAEVRTQVAAVLNHPSPLDIDPNTAFTEIGLDSLSAVELRNHLTEATGLPLPTTTVFDYPTPVVLAGFLVDQVQGRGSVAAPVAGRVVGVGVDEPVAVVGMGCRYPGGVGSAEGLWDVVVGGRDVIGDFPGDRGWDVGGLFDADPDVVGKFYNRHGGFLDDAAGFDAGFFGVSPREALAMDPQQRLLLEIAWETFESAGIDPESLRGSDTGVFAGVMGSQYGFGGGAAVEGYVSTGGAGSVASGRIAYVFGLEGPAVTVDTACSSSLVALHQACQSLRVGECSLALAGGVTVMATPVTFVEFSRQRGLSVDGRCKAFAAGADGTGFSEGVGLVLLERLSDARRCGHEVLGVIGGSAVNQDGASNGLTAPNGPSQERVIRSALACAGVSGVDVDVVEAHGTGTTLGDPIEAQAILATYGQGREWDRPLWLGSVKSNMGHTQAAAGVAGVIKMIEALRHEVLPVTLHVDAPSPHVDWSVGAVRLLTEAQPWPRVEGRVRRAGVSSFGISGTNAHVIVEEAPAVPADSDGGLDGVGVGVGEVVWVVSAKSEAALGAQAARLAQYVGARPELGVADVGWSLATGRAGLGYRGAVVGDTREELLAGLAALAGGGCGGGVVTGRVVEGKTAFVFPGQGGQWPAMAVELLDSSPVFAERMRACGEALAPFVEWSLDEVLRGGVAESALTRVDVVQPVLFAVMVSMAELWRSCGVRADMVIGHSQGEIAAAHVAGGLSLDDAARVVAVRSRMIAELAGDGGMASIGLPVDQVDARLQCWQGRISVAAHNSPASTVVSGDRDALHELVSGCEGEGVFARLIPVDYASHSVEVETLRDRLIGELSSIRPGVGEIPFYSTVSGARVGTDTLDAEYWYRNLRQRVQFEHATAALLDQGVRTFIEMGPHPVLTVAISETVEARGGDPASVSVVGSLRRDEGDWRRFLTSLAEAFVAGVGVDWSSVFGSWGPRRVGLPSYAFEHQRFWLDSSRGGVGDLGSVGLAGVGHPWLGVGVCLGGERGWLFSGRVGLDTHPWLADHAVLGVVLLPGTGFVEMVLAAGARAGLDCVDELVLEAPLVLSEGVGVALQVLVGGVDDAGCCRVDVYSRPETASGGGGEQGSWVRHGTGVLSAGGAAAGAAAAGGGGLLGGQWPPVGAQVVDVDVLYEGLAEAGFEYGPAFQGVRGVWRRGEQTFVEVALSGDGGDEGAGFGVHPALFDAVLHPGAALMMQGLAEGQVGLPFAWRGVWLGSGGVSVLRVVLEGSGSGGLRIVGVDESGAAVLGVESLDVRPVDAAGLARVGGESVESLHAVGWVAVDAAQPVSSVVVVGGGPVDLVGVLGGQVAWYPDVAGLVEAVGGGGSVPQVVVMAAPVAGAGEVAGCVREGVYGTLELVQAWLAEPALVASRLVLVTRGGVGVGEGQTPDLVVAAVDGLVRSAVGEHPGRFGLVDLDDDGGDGGVGLRAALGVVDEPRVAVRGGVVLAPRLTRVSTQLPQSGVGSVFDPQDTVLITGGTGVLGMALARHLVVEYGCGHVVLVSRRGAAAVGVDQLRGELAEHGCRVEIVAADIADRDQLGAVVGAIRAQHRLGAVVHAAGVLADGVIESMDREQVEQVLGVKVDAAWALHELTADMGLSAFVLFSSAAGIFGSAGQANYAAANAFLDGLAQYRRGLGLSGVSLAWGLWEQASAMTGQLGQVDQARIERMGLRAMTTGQGLGLFDLACGRAESVLVPAVFDHAVLRAQARAGTLPVLLGGLVRTPVKRGRVATLAQRLAQTPETEWDDVVLAEVRTQVAAVLNHPSPLDIDPNTAFTEIGLDSLSAVELRNHLTEATGLPLPTTTVFDHPNPTELATYLHNHLNDTTLCGEQSRRAASVAAAYPHPLGSKPEEEPVANALAGSAATTPRAAAATPRQDQASLVPTAKPSRLRRANPLQRMSRTFTLASMRPSLLRQLAHRWTRGEVDIRGKRVLITGSSSGIGESAAVQFARAGATVICVARRQELLDTVAARIAAMGGLASALACDLSDPSALDELVMTVEQRFGGVDILVNNAGLSIRRPLLDSLHNGHDVDRLLRLNYHAPLRLIRALAPGMLERGDGHIINVSTWAVLNDALPMFSLYTASKAALSAVSRAIEIEWAHSGVHQTTLYYPLVKTPMIAPTKEYASMPALSADEAAEWMLTAARLRPFRIVPRVALAANKLDAVSPALLNALMKRWNGSLGTP